jgi:hypothetical protein
MVCEFTCSCCGSSTAAAADALCSFLSDGTDEALAGFSSSNGYTAVQVGASLLQTAAEHAASPENYARHCDCRHPGTYGCVATTTLLLLLIG